MEIFNKRRSSAVLDSVLSIHFRQFQLSESWDAELLEIQIWAKHHLKGGTFLHVQHSEQLRQILTVRPRYPKIRQMVQKGHFPFFFFFLNRFLQS